MNPKLLVFFALVLWLASEANADSISLITLNTSFHYDREAGYNETHHGQGIEYLSDHELAYGYMRYINSFNKKSDAIHIRKGWLLIGLANGYEDASKKVKIGDDILFIAGAHFDYAIYEDYQQALRLRALITPSVTAGGLQYEVMIK